jgi:hypothetical protein
MPLPIRSACLGILAVAFANPARAADGTLDQIKAEAVSNWRRLEMAGSRLQGSFSLTENIPQTHSRLDQEGRFLISGPKSWVHFKYQPPPGQANGLVREKVLGQNLTYVFSLQRKRH